MKKSRKKEQKLIPGTALSVDTEISGYRPPSSFEARAERLGTTSLETVLEDLRVVSAKLGHFPSREEYKEHGKHFHKQVVRLHGLQALAKLIGMKGPPPGAKRRKREAKDMAYRCFNQELCVKTPPKKVPNKQEYCDECKVERRWNNFREEYND